MSTFSTASSASPPSGSAPDTPTAPSAASGRVHEDRIRAIAQKIADDAQIPGISIAVADPTGVRCAAAVGYADLASGRGATPEDQFLWFSMTKIATATAATRVHAEGVLDLDAPIGDYLPSYRPSPKHGHPTTRQLLSHTAGLGNPMPVRWVRPENHPPSPAQLARLVAKHGTPRKPVGARASYSNIGYLLAGEVIEAATGRRVEECVQDLVLAPLGMDATRFRYDAEAPRAVGYARMPRLAGSALRWVLPDGIVGPQVGPYASFQPFLVEGPAYGGLIGTAADAAKLAASHAASVTDPHPVLTHDDIEQMRTITSSGKRFDHAIGWFRQPADATRVPAFVEHYGTGGGFWNAMRIYPQDRLALVAMANTTAKWDVDSLFTQIKELSWH